MAEQRYRASADVEVPRTLFRRFRDGVARAASLEHSLDVSHVSCFQPGGPLSDRARVLCDFLGEPGGERYAEDSLAAIVMLAARRVGLPDPQVEPSVELVRHS